MKILYYNWAPLHTPGIGGGVAVYVQNVLNYLRDYSASLKIEPYFLSSGWMYDNTKVPYLRKEEYDTESTQCYSIVNSPFLAPSIPAVSQRFSHESAEIIKDIFRQFIKNNGPFDVIHFQTLEGISSDILELKQEFPGIRFIYSVHDYGLVCSNVRLWTNKKENCFVNYDKHDCEECMKQWSYIPYQWHISSRPDKPTVSLSRKTSSIVKGKRRIIKEIYHIKGSPRWFNNDYFTQNRQRNVELINNNADCILCVSERVAEVMEFFGINKDLLQVNYIGTKVADNVKYKLRTPSDTDIFTILYMGYAVEEKGFFFYLDVLEQIPNELSKRIALTFASKIDDEAIIDRLNSLRNKFHKVTLFNGYSHSDFPAIMDNVNLGVIPPLWEDNLPQVTIEMISNGVPVLTSRYGGAHELNSHPAFMFSNKDDLKAKIENINHNRQLLIDYWKYAKPLTTMDAHMAKLFSFYHK